MNYEFARDDTVPALMKTAIAAVVFGLVFLFVSVLIQRVNARKSDRYKDVQI